MKAFVHHIESHLEQNVKKYFENAIDAHVTISKDHNAFKTDIMVHEGTGKNIIIKSDGEEYDPYKSFENALKKVSRQLRKHKARIKSHYHHGMSEKYKAMDAIQYVISPFEEEENNMETGEQSFNHC